MLLPAVCGIGQTRRWGGMQIGDRMRRPSASARPHRPSAGDPSYSLVLVCAALVLMTLSEGVLISVVPSAVAGTGARVYAAARDPQAADLTGVTPIVLDITDPASVA